MKPEILLRQAESLQNYITAARRSLHENPETGFNLDKTLAFVEAELRAMGLESVRCGKAGLSATIGRGGKCFLLRADMDALPMTEQSGEAFAAKNGAAHACGHDMHTAMLLGAARLLKEHEGEINGTVKLMFQPAEEILEGAKDMISAGVLENPKPDAAMMLHVLAALPLPVGTVLVSAPGVSAPAADYFEIRVQGKGCHGAMPNTGVDPLTVAAHILLALQEIPARELSMDSRAALTVGSFHGGEASNVIPDVVTMGGTLRAYGEDDRNFIKNRMAEIIEGIAKSFRAEAKLSFTSGCPSLVNDGELVFRAEGYARELLGGKALAASAMGGGKSTGSEDFAYVSQRVPSVMLALAAGGEYPQHHPAVRFDESVLPIGAAIYAYFALRWLEENR